MPTSGTISLTTFSTRKIIDLAARKCKLVPQQITSEHIQTAFDLLHTFLSSITNKGIPLWCVNKYVLPIYSGEITVDLPRGSVDVMNFNLREVHRELGIANASSEGVADNAFDGDIDTDCTQVAPAGWIRVQYPTDVQPRINTYGILPAATGTWEISIQGSSDTISWTDIYVDDELEVVDGEWFWLDLERQVPWPFVRLLAGPATVLDVAEFYLGGRSNEVPMPKVSLDSYATMPNKTFRGRPTEYWFDMASATSAGRQVATVWPAPDSQFTFWQYVLYIKRQVMDVGTMTQELEIPQGWYQAVIDELARQMCRSIKEADEKRIPLLDADAASSASDAWGGQSDGSPSFLTPGIGVYTR